MGTCDEFIRLGGSNRGIGLGKWGRWNFKMPWLGCGGATTSQCDNVIVSDSHGGWSEFNDASRITQLTNRQERM
jgi:hypothetical protein